MTNTEAAAASLASAVALTAIAAAIPAALVLPAVSGVAVCAAVLISGYAWLRSTERKSPGVNSWDIAGGLMFVGFAAAMLSDPETIMPLFGQFPN